MLERIVCLVIGYAFGLIQTGFIYGKMHGIDIRQHGSGNSGATNTLRTLGTKAGFIVLFGDAIKCILAIVITYFLFGRNNPEYLFLYRMYTAFGVILGHDFPFYLQFKGGKGIATTIGVFSICECSQGIAWAAVVIMAIVAALIFIYITEFGAMGSFIAITPPAISGGIRLYLLYGTIREVSYLYIISCVLILLICFFTWFAHRKNIDRMLKGEEHPTSIKEMLVKAKNKRIKRKEIKKRLKEKNKISKDNQ